MYTPGTTIFLVTNAHAPITDLEQISLYCKTDACVPIKISSPICTPPEMLAKGFMTLKSPISTSCPIVQFRFTTLKEGLKETMCWFNIKYPNIRK